MTIEKLTEIERRDLIELGARPIEIGKALRIIDDTTEAMTAAGIAERQLQCSLSRAEARVRELTRERDGARVVAEQADLYRDAVESRLAAATALLKACRSELETDPNASEYYVDLIAEVRAFLANQPAAPTGYSRENEDAMTYGVDEPAAPIAQGWDVDGLLDKFAVPRCWYHADSMVCSECQPAAPTLGHPGADEVFERLQAARQPAAPTRTVIGIDLAADAPEEWKRISSRTEVEQRVLDAMGRAELDRPEWNKQATHEARNAELARRGLK